MKDPRVNEEQRSEMFAAFQNGVGVDNIAAEWNISVAYVRRILKAMGAVFPPGRTPIIDKMDATDLEEICRLYRDTDVAVAEILERFALTYQSFYEIIREMGIPARRYQKRRVSVRRYMMDLAIEYYEEGVPIKQIWAETGVRPEYLNAEIHQRGLPLRRPQARTMHVERVDLPNEDPPSEAVDE